MNIIVSNDYEPKQVFKILREWTELTQEEFGKNVNLSKMTIQGYERGVRKFTFDTLMKISKKYGYIITIEKKK